MMTTWDFSFIDRVQQEWTLPLKIEDKAELQAWCNQQSISFSPIDFEYFFLELSKSETSVFIGWINGNPMLKTVLTEKVVKQPFNDLNLWKEHAFFAPFQAFVSPYLFPILFNAIQSYSIENSASILSYSCLLIPADSNKIQDQLIHSIQLEMDQFNVQIQAVKNEQELHQKTVTFLSNHFIATINAFDDQHYQIKRKVLDSSLLLTEHIKATTRFVSFLIQRLSALQLTAEHNAQLSSFQAKIKSGKFQVERTKVSWLLLSLGISLVLILLTGIVLLFNYEPTSEKSLEQEETSFMKLSKQERQQLDSIISSHKTQQKSAQSIDQDMPFVGENLVKQFQTNNQKATDLINRWLASDTNSYTTHFSKSGIQQSAYVSTHNLTTKSGGDIVYFQNTTLQMVLILVFNENSPTILHSKYVPANTVIKWRMNRNDLMLVLPGNVVKSKLQFGDLPFQERNEQFYTHLKKHYAFITGKNPIKWIWKETNGTYYLADLSKSLEVR